jgi:hypothetical protein
MALTNQCNVCRKVLSDSEKLESEKVKMPAVCDEHLKDLQTKLKKWAPLFQKMNLS